MSADTHSGPGAPGGTAASTLRKATLRLSGMHCGSCAAVIGDALSEHAGVASTSVDFESALATVEYDDAVTSAEDLCATVVEVGYSASVAAPAVTAGGAGNGPTT